MVALGRWGLRVRVPVVPALAPTRWLPWVISRSLVRVLVLRLGALIRLCMVSSDQLFPLSCLLFAVA